jgi:hypothetical protein
MNKIKSFFKGLIPSLVEAKNAFLGLSTKAKLVVGAAVLVTVLLIALIF